MKKAVVLAAAALISASAFSQTVSANVVGYTKTELAPGYNMIRGAFVNGTNSVDIQELMDTSTLNQGTTLTGSDSLQFWDPIGLKYDNYFVHSGAGFGNAAKTGMWIDNSTGEIAVKEVAPGEGFFFSSVGATNSTIVIAGDVVVAETGTNTLSIVEGYNLVANPFSAEWDVNDGSIDWIAQGAAAGTTLTGSDSIQLWNADTLQYDNYFLHSGAGFGNAAKTGKWIDNSTGEIATLVIGIDQGFFYSRVIGQGSLSIDIAQPYTLD